MLANWEKACTKLHQEDPFVATKLNLTGPGYYYLNLFIFPFTKWITEVWVKEWNRVVLHDLAVSLFWTAHFDCRHIIFHANKKEAFIPDALGATCWRAGKSVDVSPLPPSPASLLVPEDRSLHEISPLLFANFQDITVSIFLGWKKHLKMNSAAFCYADFRPFSKSENRRQWLLFI